MTHLTLILALILVCAGWGSPKPPIKLDPPTEIAVLTPPTDKVIITIKSLTGFNPTQEIRYRKVVARTQEVINSVEFKKEVLNFQYKGKAQFFDTLDSTQTVLSKILVKDIQLEYRLEYMRLGSSTIGYTYPNVSWIALNARKFDGLSDKDLSANLVHELLGHKIGRYGHSFKHTSNRPYSVPYGLGTLAAKLY